MELIYHTCYFSFYRVDNVACWVQPAPTTRSEVKEAIVVKSLKCTASSQKNHHVDREARVGPQPRRHWLTWMWSGKGRQDEDEEGSQKRSKQRESVWVWSVGAPERLISREWVIQTQTIIRRLCICIYSLYVQIMNIWMLLLLDKDILHWLIFGWWWHHTFDHVLGTTEHMDIQEITVSQLASYHEHVPRIQPEQKLCLGSKAKVLWS